jgi:hypothetical protein
LDTLYNSGVADALARGESLPERMTAAVPLGGVDQPAVADAPAATPNVAGHIGRGIERLAPPPASRAEEPPAAEQPAVVGHHREPRMAWRVPARERGPVAPGEVLEHLSDVERHALLDDVGMALGPSADPKSRERHAASLPPSGEPRTSDSFGDLL